MIDRDRHWLDKLYQLICDTPYISLARLGEHTKRLSSPERLAYLKRLHAAGKIEASEADNDSGHSSWHFWPVIASATATTPAERLTSTLDEAKRLLASLAACIESASGMVGEMATAGLAVAGPEIAGVPAGAAVLAV